MSKDTKIKGLRILAAGVRVVAILLVMVIASVAITSVHIFLQLSNEHSLWEKMPNSVRLLFGTADAVQTEKTLSDIDAFCREMEQNNNLYLSLAVDESVFLDPPEYGGYDHIIITNKGWTDSFDTGIGQKEKGGELTEVSFQTLSDPLQKFLEAQIPIWTRSKTVQPEGLGYYTFTGEKFPGLPPDLGYSGTTVQAQNPLVILVDSPVSTFDTKEFLLPVLSSGNIVFPDQQMLLEGLSVSPMNKYDISVDTVAGVVLSQTKLYGKEAGICTGACILILIAMVCAGIMEARLWTKENRDKIIALHTSGMTCYKIMKALFYRELVIVVITVLIGGAVSYVLTHSNLIALTGMALVIVLLYLSGMAYGIARYTKSLWHKNEENVNV